MGNISDAQRTVTRAVVVAEARTWLGTPYRHQARLKGVAVDCIGLVVGVARSLGIVAQDFDFTGYSRQPDGVTLMRVAREHMTEMPVANMQPGDVIVMFFQRDPCHFGIVTPYRHGGLAMIHALQRNDGRGEVVEHRIAPFNAERIVAAFTLPKVS